MALAAGPEDFVCSARGCDAPATLQVVWSNPTLHWAREKTWLSCDAHAGELADYIELRGFPHRTEPFEPPPTQRIVTSSR